MSNNETSTQGTEQRPCKRPFMDCQEPAVTVFDGVRCEACGVIMTAEEWDKLDHAERERMDHEQYQSTVSA
jgi:hypothetical protein